MSKSEPVRYMSRSPKLLVSFNEDRLQTKKGPLSWGMAKFEGNIYDVVPDKDYGAKYGKGHEIIDRLDTHPLNRENGGAEFWKMDNNAVDIMEYTSGKMVARNPVGGITKKIEDDLTRLHGYIEGYDSKKHKEVVGEVKGYFDAFSVIGIQKPGIDMDQLRVRGRLIEFFGVLKDREIWEPKIVN